MLAFWSGLSPWHLLLVGALALLFYGNRLPEVARSLGKAVNEFKRGLREVQDGIENDDPDADSGKEPRKLEPPVKEVPSEPVNEREKEPVETGGAKGEGDE